MKEGGPMLTHGARQPSSPVTSSLLAVIDGRSGAPVFRGSTNTNLPAWLGIGGRRKDPVDRTILPQFLPPDQAHLWTPPVVLVGPTSIPLHLTA